MSIGMATYEEMSGRESHNVLQKGSFSCRLLRRVQQVLLHTDDTGCSWAENLAVTVALKKRVKPSYSPD